MLTSRHQIFLLMSLSTQVTQSNVFLSYMFFQVLLSLGLLRKQRADVENNHGKIIMGLNGLILTTRYEGLSLCSHDKLPNEESFPYTSQTLIAVISPQISYKKAARPKMTTPAPAALPKPVGKAGAALPLLDPVADAEAEATADEAAETAEPARLVALLN